MKDEDLKQLEESGEIKRILEISKRLYDKDKEENQPRSFHSLMQQIEQQKGSSRKTTVSPWWLAAACLIGILIGWNFPFENASKKFQLAVNDTVVITEKHTDTIYQEAQVVRKTMEEKRMKPEKQPIRPIVVPELLNEQRGLPHVMMTEVPLIDPDAVRPSTTGRSLSQEEFPIHLLVSM